MSGNERITQIRRSGGDAVVVTEAHTTAESLFERHATELMRFATSLIGPSDAADLVSVCFVGAMASGALDRVSNPRAYLYRCVLNAARSDARSTFRRRRREQTVAVPDTATTTEIADPAVWAALARLSDRQRAVVYMTYWMDMTPDSIAEMLDLSSGSVKKHLDRGRTALRSSLGGER